MRNSLLFLIALLLTGAMAKAETSIKSLGFAFGSPALLAARLTARQPESSWLYQIEVSRQVLKHNRTNGELTTLRLDAHYIFEPWELMEPFVFLGGAYFDGYYNKASERTSILAFDGGVGLDVPINARWVMSGEFGITLPTKSDPGLVYYGIIANMGLRWTFSMPEPQI